MSRIASELKAIIKSCKILNWAVLARRRLISKRYRRMEMHLEKVIKVRGQEASDCIHSLIASGKPCLIGRFGSCEIGIVEEYCRKKGRIDLASNDLVATMATKGGFYPVTAKSIRHFSELYAGLMEDIDVLGSWRQEEYFFRRNLRRAIRIPLKDLEPYMHEKPWTRALSGKKVLVINPFVTTISSQYKKRKLLFSNGSVLPEFDLALYRPVFEFDPSDRVYDSWFDALAKMEKDIDGLSFDVALIGCGPFGMPLAARVKETGRQAIVLGGATQILFGIKGGRWDKEPFFKALYNENWVYPSSDETPVDSMTLEQGCYWKPSGD